MQPVETVPDGGGTVFRTVVSHVGLLLVAVGVTMCVPLLVSLLYAEWHSAVGFLLACLTTVVSGIAAYLPTRQSEEPRRLHALLIAGIGWLVVGIFGALPFIIVAYITPHEVAQQFVPRGQNYISSLMYFRNPLHAIFESMSAFTTTGLTMSVREPSIGHGLLFYRSFAQWIGGAGVIVLALSILRAPRGIGSVSLYVSEAHEEKLRPKRSRHCTNHMARLRRFDALECALSHRCHPDRDTGLWFCCYTF